MSIVWWTLRIVMDVVNSGGGVRMMKPSGVGGDGPYFRREFSKSKATEMWRYLPGGGICIACDMNLYRRVSFRSFFGSIGLPFRTTSLSLCSAFLSASFRATIFHSLAVRFFRNCHFLNWSSYCDFLHRFSTDLGDVEIAVETHVALNWCSVAISLMTSARLISCSRYNVRIIGSKGSQGISPAWPGVDESDMIEFCRAETNRDEVGTVKTIRCLGARGCVNTAYLTCVSICSGTATSRALRNTRRKAVDVKDGCNWSQDLRVWE